MSGGIATLERFALALRAGGRWCISLALAFATVALATHHGDTRAAGIQISAARVWSSVDYTRVTLESGTPVRHAVQNDSRGACVESNSPSIDR